MEVSLTFQVLPWTVLFPNIGAKFAKFCRDNNVQHGKVTSTEVDIVFNKVKAKNARKIGFEEFKEALKILAAKRYEQKTGDDAYKFLVHQIVTNDNRPIAKATVSIHDTDCKK
jgi:hypothetical protein